MRLVVFFCMLLAAAMANAQFSSVRERKLLDFGWRFHLGNAADMTKDFGFGSGQMFAKAGEAVGPVKPSFNDSYWRKVNLPHDWVVEEEFVHDDDSLHVAHGSKPVGRKYPEKAIGWYRRTFDIPSSDNGRRLSVEFDGVYRDSLVWLNGHLLGRETSGYSSFSYDITDFVNYGGNNVLVVRADTSQYEGWFYEGGGIYRHVWLVKTSPVHVAHWGTFATSRASGDLADVTLSVKVQNDSDKPQKVTVDSYLPDIAPHGDNGKPHPYERLASDDVEVGAWSTAQVVQKYRVKPHLWSLEDPHLYTVSTRLRVGEQEVDQYDTTFGIRTIHFDADNGFFLNGKRVEIKGTCNHQDHAGVGSALPDRLQYFRIEQLKKMGCNAYRTSHNPPTPELLDACDRLGMLVMDENRLMDSSTEIQREFANQINRDRNHPSVILWSIGNEEFEQDTDRGRRVAETLVRIVHALDPSRLTTYAGNNGANYDGVNAVVDVRGFNYITIGTPDPYHADHPSQPIMGSEEASTLSTRGEYANDPVKGYMRAYDTEKPGWGTTAEEWWSYYSARPYLAGAFVWTGFDYRGEPTPYGWPCISSHFGILDTCGFPKDNFYYYQAWWSDQNVLHLLPHWNWPGKEGQPIEVWCYSNQDEVELLLNGKSLGRKAMPPNGHVEWSVAYKPGTLEARGYRGGKWVKTEKVETTGPPARIVLTPDRKTISADGEDVSVITVSVVDSRGRVVPDASEDIQFSTEGGAILGVGNGDPSSHEKDKFVSSVTTIPVIGWQMQPVAKSDDPLSFTANWPGAKTVDVAGRATGLPENSFAAYRASFDVTPAMLKSDLALSVGQVDDLGWVYMNGKKVGETTDWDTAYAFDIRKLVHEGSNSVVVIVQNNSGPGGLGGGVSISYSQPAEAWHRKVFHGLAQIILQAGMKPGEMTLKVSSPILESSTIRIQATEADFRGL